MNYHPKLDEYERKVRLHKPSQASELAAWSEPASVATAIPDGPMPAELNGIAFAPWTDAPRTAAGWESLVAHLDFDEPPFAPPKNKRHAAGVVIEEADGRIWLVSPSNAHAGYITTFPKGTVDPGASRRATAIKEAFEESGLRVELSGYFADADRSRSYTRYYLARRVGGSPADMGWESQAVHLVPRSRLANFLLSHNDSGLLAKLLAEQRSEPSLAAPVNLSEKGTHAC